LNVKKFRQTLKYLFFSSGKPGYIITGSWRNQNKTFFHEPMFILCLSKDKLFLLRGKQYKSITGKKNVAFLIKQGATYFKQGGNFQAGRAIIKGGRGALLS
jgi:hypothetical protein